MSGAHAVRGGESANVGRQLLDFTPASAHSALAPLAAPASPFASTSRMQWMMASASPSSTLTFSRTNSSG